MRKIAVLFLCGLLAACLWACGAQQSNDETVPTEVVTEEPTVQEQPATKPSLPENVDVSSAFQFPDGTMICGTDVSGMTTADAYAAISEALNEHTLALTVNRRNITLTGSDMGLACPENAVNAYAAALEAEEDPTVLQLLTYDTDAVRQRLSNALNVSARNASLRYNSSKDSFQITEESSGKSVNISSIMEELDPVILSLGTSLTVTAYEEVIEPTITADSDTAKKALDKANKFLTVSLTYSYTPDNGETKYETISKDTIGSLISCGNDMSPYISSTALRSYVDQMSKKYSVKGDAGKFKTSGGYYISITVDYAGQPVDTDGLYDDIYHCLSNGISGTRTAPYLDAVECEQLAFDGNYVEINLSAQYLWVYRNGSCVVSTPIVSGCAYYHNTTPTGVYSIYSKSTGVNLVGETWNSYVNYWMPFYGGYGLHDASWRSSFGGDIYLYDGSHGCVNLPSGVAGSVYNNVSVGTKVILYGGASGAEPVKQNIVGTAQYDVSLGADPFKLDAKPEYGDDKTVTYVSSNPAVATVAADGTITVKGAGTASITVTAAEREYYTSAEMTVTIKVTNPCVTNGHTFGKWKVTTPATCTADGKQQRICDICDHPEEEVIPAGHSYGDWTETLAPTCTVNGEKAHTCGACGDTQTEVVPAPGHSFGGWTEVLTPTCTADGNRQHTCCTCGHTEDEAIPATGHSVSTWNTDTEPTCTAPGSKSGVCGSCGETVTEEIPMKEHNFSSGGATCDSGCGAPNPNYQPPTGGGNEGTDTGEGETQADP